METRFGNSGTQALINSLVWENGYSQVTDSPNRGDALLDVYLIRPESSYISSGRVQGSVITWSVSGSGMGGYMH